MNPDSASESESGRGGKVCEYFDRHRKDPIEIFYISLGGQFKSSMYIPITSLTASGE